MRETYIKTIHYDDGNIAVMDATEEVVRMRRELKRPAKETQETMSVEEVAKLYKYSSTQTVYNKIAKGDFANGIHYKKTKGRILFFKKALLKELGMV